MPPRRRILVPALAAVLAALAGVPGAAAQTIPAPEELPPVTELPQAEEPEPEPAPEEPAPEEPAPAEPAPAEERPDRPSASELPDTGSDARVVALLGATVLLTGVGLRLRTRPEHF